MRLMLAAVAFSLGMGVAFGEDRPLPDECWRSINDVRQEAAKVDSIRTPVAVTIVRGDAANRMIKSIHALLGVEVDADTLVVLTWLNTGNRDVYFVAEGCVAETSLPVSRDNWQRIAAQ
jgi:hypothetical protein